MLFVVAMLAYFQLSSIQEFDPNKQLHQSQWLAKFKLQTDWKISEQSRLTIIVDEDCGCTLRAEDHIQQLAALAGEENLLLQHLASNEMLSAVVPNTPAAVLLSKQGELVYAGPLSEGIACSTGSGFVEAAITNLQKGFNSQLKITDSKGCYCR